MSCFELVYSPKRIAKVADYWTLLIPFVLANTLWFSLSDKIRYVILNTNYFVNYIKFNLVIFIYIAIICGVVALVERDFKKIFSMPLFFVPYLFIPIYLRIFEALNLPPMFSISISFVHSLLSSFNCYKLSIHVIRTIVCILIMLVVRRWLSVTL